MLPASPLIMILLLTVVSDTILSMIDLAGASLYDIRQIKSLKRLRKNPHSKNSRYKPLVSVVIPIYDQEEVIESTLSSVLKSSYRKLEIIVVDNASSDDTKRVVKNFKKTHPKRVIKLVTKRKNIGSGAAVSSVLKTLSKSELIMTLEAGDRLDSHCLKNAVRHFSRGDISALAANVSVMEHPSLLSLLQQFDALASSRSKKLSTIAISGYAVGGSGTIYHRDILKKLRGFTEQMWVKDNALSSAITVQGKGLRPYYGSDVVVYTEPAASYFSLFKQRYLQKLHALQAIYAKSRPVGFMSRIKPLVIWRELVTVLETLLTSYFLYLAVVFRKPFLYGLIWAAVSFFLAFAVWADDQLSSRKKMRLIIYIPVMYSLIYLVMIVQTLAIFKYIFSPKRFPGRKVERSSSLKTSRAPSKA